MIKNANLSEVITNEYCEECGLYNIALSYGDMLANKELVVDHEFDTLVVADGAKSATVIYKVGYEGYITCPECNTKNSTVGYTSLEVEA